MLQPSAFGPQPTVLAQGGLFAKQKRIQTNTHMQHMPPKGWAERRPPQQRPQNTRHISPPIKKRTIFLRKTGSRFFSCSGRFGQPLTRGRPLPLTAASGSGMPPHHRANIPPSPWPPWTTRGPATHFFFREYLPPAFVFSCKTRKLIREVTGQCGGRC